MKRFALRLTARPRYEVVELQWANSRWASRSVVPGGPYRSRSAAQRALLEAEQAARRLVPSWVQLGYRIARQSRG